MCVYEEVNQHYAQISYHDINHTTCVVFIPLRHLRHFDDNMYELYNVFMAVGDESIDKSNRNND